MVENSSRSGSTMLSSTINETYEIQRILDVTPRVNRPRIMLQIGASEGGLAQRFAARGWEVFAFEANPLYRAQLEERQALKGLHLYNLAIATEERDQVTFYVSQNHTGIGSLKKFHPTHQAIEVPATTLRKFYAENGITAIDYFMIDAELMDLKIMETHDWSIPISALLMECGIGSIGEICDFILSRVPSYRHIVFCWQKPTGACGEQGVCVGKMDSKAFMNMPRNCFGNVLFYQYPFREQVMHVARTVKQRIPILGKIPLRRRP